MAKTSVTCFTNLENSITKITGWDPTMRACKIKLSMYTQNTTETIDLYYAVELQQIAKQCTARVNETFY